MIGVIGQVGQMMGRVGASTAMGGGDAGLPNYASAVGFGDSITNYVGASDPAHAWLNLVGAAIGAGTPLNQGISGTVLQNSPDAGGSARANNGRDRFATALLGGNKRALALIAYGFNDARYIGSPSTFDVTLYAADLREVLTGLRIGGYAPSDIVVIAPYWITDTGLATGSTGFAGQTRAGFEAFVAAAAQVAQEFGTYYVDMYAYMRDNGGASLIGGDNIHPTDTGHAAIAQGVRTQSAIANSRAVPTSLMVASPEAGQLLASWTAAPEATGYTVEYGVEGSYTFSTSQTVTSASYLFTGVPSGSFRVRARANFADGPSRWVFASSAQAVAASGGATFLNDTFTDTAGTLLTAHAPETGGAWAVQSSFSAPTPPPAISAAGRVYAGGATTVYRNAAVPASADYTVTGVAEFLSSVNSENLGVMGRADAAVGTFYFARWNSNGNWQLFKTVAGAGSSQLGTDFPDTFLSGSRTVQLKMVGSTISMLVDIGDGNGLVQRTSATDTAITAAGGAGIRQTSSSPGQTATTGRQFTSIVGAA